MIIPIWQDQPQPSEDMQVQVSEIPRTQHLRMLIKSPTVNSLTEYKEKLMKAGVPTHARIEFSQWNAPNSNWYIHATWQGEQ